MDFILFEYAKPLVITLLVLIIFQILLLITARIHWVIRFVGVPLLLIFALYSYSYMDKMLGYPYPGEIPENSAYLGRQLDNRFGNLYYVIWAKTGSLPHRLYLIPWTTEQEKKFRVQESGMKGKRGQVVIRRLGSGNQANKGQPSRGAGDKSKANKAKYGLFLIPIQNPPDKI